MDDNITQQLDEIEALSAIFGSQWEADPEIKNSFTFLLNADVQLFITFNKDYPSESPPDYQLLAPNLHKTAKTLIENEFNTIYEQNKGCPIIFQWIEKLKEVIEANNEIKPNKIIAFKEEEDEDEIDLNFNITHGPVIQDRKSIFQGHACAISHESEVAEVLEYLKRNKKIAQATHNISAYRIKDSNVLYQDYDDDGESHAGQRLLHLLQILDTVNVIVVVTRWYGGIHLGPKRFQHINNAARQALQEAGFIR